MGIGAGLKPKQYAGGVLKLKQYARLSKNPFFSIFSISVFNYFFLFYVSIFLLFYFNLPFCVNCFNFIIFIF